VYNYKRDNQDGAPAASDDKKKSPPPAK